MRMGWTELIIIISLVLIVIGGGKLSGIGKSIGKNIKEFKEEIEDNNEEKTE